MELPVNPNISDFSSLEFTDSSMSIESLSKNAHRQKYLQDMDEKYQTEVKQISKGNSFGELALISNKPRAATIKCIE